MTDLKKIPVLAIITGMVIAGAFVVADSATSDADGGGGTTKPLRPCTILKRL